MQLQFEDNLDYQKDAIEAVLSVLKGQPKIEDAYAEDLSGAPSGVLDLRGQVYANALLLTPQQILSNIQKTQRQNGLPIQTSLQHLSYRDEGAEKAPVGRSAKTLFKNPIVNADFVNLTLEMETGTGKTYVYLRTIYELHAHFGLRKFIIVVPSIAIREGVFKNLELTHPHFQELYGKPPARFQVYQARNLSLLASFASSPNIEILVMNIDSFAKDQNVINQIRENGIQPIEYLQACRPVVIIDEPQNMETDIRKKAIHSLNPLLALRYSATHRQTYNLIYRLDPIKAYDLGLVKQISVLSVVSENDQSVGYLELQKITSTTQTITAHFTMYVATAKGAVKKAVKASPGDDLYELSGGLEPYKGRYFIALIDKALGFVEFGDSKKTRIYVGEALGGLGEALLQAQIEATVQKHLERELELANIGIKVLSLFFIDKVAHYRTYTEQGKSVPGKYAAWLETAYKRALNRLFLDDYYASHYGAALEKLFELEPARLHNGYFAQDKKTGQFKDSKESARKVGASPEEESAYNLIMREKERLLSMEEPLRFIFSHSALREGWDNPNVFQICTLSDTRSELKKRQEIGRGLRLAVNQAGVRVKDKAVNRLVVIANESYEEFACKLQEEIAEDCGVVFDNARIKNEKARQVLRVKKHYELDSRFKELWDRIQQKTEYSIRFDLGALLQRTIQSLKNAPPISPPAIRKITADLEFTETGIGAVEKKRSQAQPLTDCVFSKANVFEFLRHKLNLPASYLYRFVKENGLEEQVCANPQAFQDLFIQTFERERQKLLAEGIRYEKIDGEVYKMHLLREKEIYYFLEKIAPVMRKEKNLHDYFACDSEIERKFMQACEACEDILFYIKLPSWFVIPTPLGDYNPNWVLVYKDSEQVYFVAETKGSAQKD